MASSLVVALRNKLRFMEQSLKQKLDEAACMEKKVKETSMKADDVSSKKTCFFFFYFSFSFFISSNYHLYILTKSTTVFVLIFRYECVYFNNLFLRLYSLNQILALRKFITFLKQLD